MRYEVKEQQRLWEGEARGPALPRPVAVKRRAASPGMRQTKSDLTFNTLTSAVPGAKKRAVSPNRYPRGYPGAAGYGHGYGGYGGAYGHPAAYGAHHAGYPGHAGGRYGAFPGYGHPGYGGHLGAYGGAHPFYGPSLGHVGKYYDHAGYLPEEHWAQEENDLKERRWKK